MFARGFVLDHWRKPSRLRLLLSLAFLVVGWLILAGAAGVDDWDWVRVVSFITTVFAFVVVVLVPDHFLEDHLWGHVIKRHAFGIFLWTLGALSATHFIVNVLQLDTLSPEGRWAMLGVACLAGLIPESGPHMIFVSMYANGGLPMSVLVANSIVQDGHGAIPLLGESRKAFLLVKAIKFLVGLFAGAALLGLGW